jgi:hypothetical protein
MMYPEDAAQFVGKMVFVRWQIKPEFSEPGQASSGGRVTRVDEAYLYLQPLGASSGHPLRDGQGVTHLGLRDDEERIALVDIEAVDEHALDQTIIED